VLLAEKLQLRRSESLIGSDHDPLRDKLIRLVPRTPLPNSGLEVSRISLGLSRLHHMKSVRERVRLIDTARGLGITHFDTARLYGDGLSERTLGRAIGRHRSSVTIATKFGMLATDWMGALGSAGWPFWAARSALRRFGLIAYHKRSYSVSTMRSSLDASLRLLRTDYVDVLLIHDPPSPDFEQRALLFDALDTERRAGKIRHIGIAGQHAQALALADPDLFGVVQTSESMWRGDSPVPDFTYGAIRAGLAGAGENQADGAHSALARALARRANGSVLVGTTNVDHLRHAAQVATSGP
jgi:aryl-alcohol dehydrogenase-like predicted oxidoreductase